MDINNYINRITDALISRNLVYDEFSQVNKKQRPSILNHDKIKSDYGPMIQITIEADSCEEGYISDDSETEIVYTEPSLRFVIDFIFDIKTLMNINV